MHLYYLDPKRLESELNGFAGGQFQMKTLQGWGFRGQFKECIVLVNRRIKISFDWLCERRFVFDKSWTPYPKWFFLKPPPGLHYLEIEFRYFYSQPDEDRVKMKGFLGEVCHFYRREDHTNLVQHGDEFIPYCELHELEFRMAVIALLSPKRQ